MGDTLRVLYVDDEPGLLEIGKLFLERGGAFNVDTVTSAGLALEQLKTERYDAIISDYQMPEMDGITFLKQLKGSGNTTPFIIFTGRGREEVVIDALNNGADFYLQKGGEPKSQFAELANKIQHAVGRKQAEDLVRESDQRLSDITNFLPVATFAIDTQGQVIAWNKAIEEMTGVPARDMTGKGNYEYSLPFYKERRPILIDLVSLPDEELTQNRYANIKREGNILIAETSLPRPLGRCSVLKGKASVLYNSKGNISGAIESIRDITDQVRAETELTEAAARYEALIAASNTGAWEFHKERGYLWCSPEYFSLLGRDISDFDLSGARNIEQTWLDLLHNEDRQEAGRHFDAYLSNPEGMYEQHFRMLHKDGHWVWIWSRGKTLRDAEGNPTGITVGTHIDITDRKRAEEELLKKNEALEASYEQITAAEEELHANLDELTRQERALKESEERYSQFFRTTLDSVFITTVDGQWVDCNDALVEIFGYRSREEVFNLPVSSFYAHPEKRAEFLRCVERDGYVKEYPQQFRKKDGTVLEGLITIVSQKNPDGTVKGFIGTVHDISERKRVFAPHSDREPFNESRAENLTDYIVVYGPDGTILYINPAAVSALGYDRAVMIGTPVLSYVAEQYRETVISHMAARQELGEIPLYDIVLLTRDGLHRSAIVKGTQVQYHNTPATLLLLIDISRRKELEDELTARAAELLQISTAFEAANKQLVLLTRITRHDINNQLTVMLGYLDLLEKQVDPALKEYLLTVTAAANRIASMIRFTREYVDIGVSDPAWQEIPSVIDTAAREVPHGPVLLKNDIPAGTEVFADPLIAKVFYNLMDNAVRYGRKITTIRFSVEKSGEDHMIVCEDDGDGVSAEEKEQIFDRGFGKNTGLGLALSREILAITGITLKETGEPGKGARFEMRVPDGSYRMSPDSGDNKEITS